ncbi:DUF2155 domain-containing protein [Acuticoccus sediminis]|uniref:DUF2155 domain-containing protein n=1 Tax=Acuticoccus sediminis TaxID=2184697 RepID=A0A8B2NNF1_9HYPH|nr:DUF2155 domain-containing protein [Acuticoccus sediminis]RAH98257.1 DUF2155 domain-containing protein [Acuticoccus sediminis]
MLRPLVPAMLAALALVGGSPAEAEPIENPIAVFSGLDKVTGRIISFDVYINETVQFGALRVTPRTCQTQPPTEEPNTVAFAEVDEITLDSRIRRIFTGWMFAASPGLNAVDHPVYDVWLKDCALSTEVAPPTGFNEDKYAQDEMGVIERPEGWQPIPKPRPFHASRAPIVVPEEGELED